MPSPKESSWQGIEPTSLMSPAFASGFFTTTTTRGVYESKSHSVMSDPLWCYGLYSPWNSPGQNPGVGNFSLLQGIFSTQRSNQSLQHCRWILYQLSHKGSPRILEWVAYPFSSGSFQPRNRTQVSCIQADSLPTELSGKPKDESEKGKWKKLMNALHKLISRELI